MKTNFYICFITCGLEAVDRKKAAIKKYLAQIGFRPLRHTFRHTQLEGKMCHCTITA